MKACVATPEAYQLFHEGAIALARMERNGICVDTEYLYTQRETVTKEIEAREANLRKDRVFDIWRREYGARLKINSVRQLSHVLYDILGYKSKGKTATGQEQLDDAALADIDLPFVQEFRVLKRLLKVRSTYIDGMLREVVNDFIHPFFNLAGGGGGDDRGGPVSYRGSSDSPNFQNMPVRNKKMAELARRAIKSRFKRGRIVEKDFKGIEVGVACCYNHDPVLIDYVKNSPPKDMHRDAAAMLLLLEQGQVSKEARHAGKNLFVFPEFYGSYYIDCAKAIWESIRKQNLRVGSDGASLFDHLKSKGIKRLGACVPEEKPKKGTFEYHVKEVEDYFWNEQYVVYTQWKKDWWNAFLERGYFRMHTGFVCVWGKGGIPSRNDVINYPVQGSAFHCLLWCLIRLTRLLRKYRMRTLLIGQIHDSLIADVPDEELQDYLDLTEEVMSRDLPKHWPWICVPMKAESEVCPIGGTWYEKKEWTNKEGRWEEAA